MAISNSRGSYDPEQTRKNLMEAAMLEIHKKGFRAAGMDAILKMAGVTKGALYHHFRSKSELGYAVVEEFIGGMVRQHWMEPLEGAENPLDAMIHMFETKEFAAEEIELGCPLNNLANEMAPIDDTFRKLIEQIYSDWRQTYTRALQQAQDQGQMTTELDASSAANYIIASIEGMASVCKNAQDNHLPTQLMSTMVYFLNSLRAKQPAATT